MNGLESIYAKWQIDYRLETVHKHIIDIFHVFSHTTGWVHCSQFSIKNRMYFVQLMECYVCYSLIIFIQNVWKLIVRTLFEPNVPAVASSANSEKKKKEIKNKQRLESSTTDVMWPVLLDFTDENVASSYLEALKYKTKAFFFTMCQLGIRCQSNTTHEYVTNCITPLEKHSNLPLPRKHWRYN